MKKSKTSSVSKQQETNSKGNRRGLSEGSRANLEKGRELGAISPKSASITTSLRQLLTKEDAEAIAKQLIADAINKPPLRSRYTKDGTAYDAYDPIEVSIWENARGIVLERLDGKVTQVIAGDPDRPLAINLVNNIAGLGNAGSKDD